MFRRKSLGAVFLSIFCLFFICLYAANQPSLPAGLNDLVFGSETDTQGVLGSLKDRDLPSALSVCQTLKFRAIHKEISLTLAEVETFEKALHNRLEKSQTVSWKKTETCSIHIPSKEITVAGQKIKVPAHFAAKENLEIVDYTPKGEAGTIFPEIGVDFAGGQPPIAVRLTLNGKKIQPKIEDSRISYQPTFNAGSLVPIGTHTVSIEIKDSTGQTASTSWFFTVGIKPVSVPSVPNDAVLVGSLSISIDSLVPNSGIKGEILVKIFEIENGKRILEYTLFSDPTGTKPFLKTTSLYLVGRIASKKQKDDPLAIFPRTPYAFVGNLLTFSYVYSGSGTPSGTIWYITGNGGDPISIGGETVQLELKADVYITLAVKAEYQSPDGGSYAVVHYCQKEVKDIDVFGYNLMKRVIIPTESDITKVPLLFGNRCVADPGTGKNKNICEGETFPFPTGEKGVLSIKKARWKVFAGNAKADFENSIATNTNIVFQGQGYVEFDHELNVAFDWENEHYEGDIPPDETSLFGVYPYKGSTVFGKYPSGIIFGTSRQIRLQKIDLEINGEKRVITEQIDDTCRLDPPIQFAVSELFPNSPPLRANVLNLGIIQKTETGFQILPEVQNFQTLLKYEKPEQIVENKIFTRCYFGLEDSKTKSRRKIKEDPYWSFFFQFFRPISPWLPVDPYPSPVELVQVIVFPQEAEIPEGGKVEFNAAIVPKAGMGTGELTEAGGSLDLLEGYQAQTAEKIDWQAILLPQRKLWKNGNGFKFTFDPQQGTGTYEIIASTVLEVKEKDTESLAKVTGIGSTTVLVKPGLKITSPIASFVYPLGSIVNVTTTLDKNPDEWKQIKWTLNGKEWKPDTSEPPHKLLLDKGEDWSLKAEFEVSPQETLSDEVAFKTKTMSISITPSRQVTALPGSYTVPLQMKVSINNQIVEKLNQEVPWEGNTLTAKVTKIEWGAITNPPNIGKIKPEPDSFNAVAEFDSPGALTGLATVTIQIDKPNKTKPKGPKKAKRETSQVIVVPGGRVDLWGLKSPDWQGITEGLPKEAIAKSKRTITPKTGTFDIQGKTYNWSPSGLSPEINLDPALADNSIPPAQCTSVSFLWQGTKGKLSNTSNFVVDFKEKGSFPLNLVSSLDFGQDGKIPFKPENHTVEVSSLENFVKVEINPANFWVPFGGEKKLCFIVKPLVRALSTKEESEILLLNDEYRLTLGKVDWTKEATETKRLKDITSPEFPFSSPIPGTFTIKAVGNLNLQEISGKGPAPAAVNQMEAFAKGYVGKFITYPGNYYSFPARTQLNFTANDIASDPNDIKWLLNDQEIGIGTSVSVNLAPGSFTVKAQLTSTPAIQETKSIYVFDWKVLGKPDSYVLLWEGKTLQKDFSFEVTADGQPIPPLKKLGKSLSKKVPGQVGSAMVKIATSTLTFQSEPKVKIQVSPISNLCATCTFEVAGRMEAIATHTLEVTQPDGKKDPFDISMGSILMGAITANASYSFSFEPVRAIIGMTRQFEVGSVTLCITDKLVPAITDFPATFSNPVEIIQPLMTHHPPIKIVGFDHGCGFQPTDENLKNISGKSLKVPFMNAERKKIFWDPFASFDSSQNLSLPKIFRIITPKKLSDYITTRIEIGSSATSINGKIPLSFFFRKKGEDIDYQETITLENGDYQTSLSQVIWSANGSSIGVGPNIYFSQPLPGYYTISAEGAFRIDPREGKEFGCNEKITPSNAVVEVTGLLESWEVTNKVDHLKGISKVVNSPPYFERYYEKNGPWVWKQEGTKEAKTQPLVVGCEATVALKPNFSLRPAEIAYTWTTNDGTIILFGHAPFFSEAVEIPTPKPIGRYLLELSALSITKATFPVFVVQKITSNTADKVYYDKCVEDSVTALSGLGKPNSEKELADKFYDWWWNVQKDYQYYVEAYDTGKVILKGGGMCMGLGNFFYKALECQGLAGEESQSIPRLRRMAYYVYPFNPFDKKNIEKFRKIRGLHFRQTMDEDLPYTPTSPEYWGAFLVTDPGLNRQESVFSFPNTTSKNSYASEPLHLQKENVHKIPPPVASWVFFPNEIDLQTIPSKKAYPFYIRAKNQPDGHGFVIFEEKDSFKLYDPSFGKNRFKYFDLEKTEIPIQPGEVKLLNIIEFGGEKKKPKFWRYLCESIYCWRSNTFCNESKFVRGLLLGKDQPLLLPERVGSKLRIIDVRPEEINFLTLLIDCYRSSED